jgi:hypothetical protein
MESRSRQTVRTSGLPEIGDVLDERPGGILGVKQACVDDLEPVNKSTPQPSDDTR